jgi:hypothetical protein
MTPTATRLRDQSDRMTRRLIEKGKEQLVVVEELTAAIVAEWADLNRQLEGDGLSGRTLADLTAAIVHAVAGAREGIRLLRAWPGETTHAGWWPEGLDDLAARLDRIGPKAERLLALAQAPPPAFDPARLRIGMEQAARGEGEDAETILARLRAGGEA